MFPEISKYRIQSSLERGENTFIVSEFSTLHVRTAHSGREGAKPGHSREIRQL
jgi:hypothetical protein